MTFNQASSVGTGGPAAGKPEKTIEHCFSGIARGDDDNPPLGFSGAPPQERPCPMYPSMTAGEPAQGGARNSLRFFSSSSSAHE